MGLIRYKAGNAVGAAGAAPPGLIANWEEENEAKETVKVSLSLSQALVESTAWTTVSTDGAFSVDDVKYAKLVAALDAHPGVYRAGGGTPALADPIRTD